MLAALKKRADQLEQRLASVEQNAGSSNNNPKPSSKKPTLVMLAASTAPAFRTLFAAMRAAKSSGSALKPIIGAKFAVPQVRTPNNVQIKTVPLVARFLFRLAGMEPTDHAEQSEVDQWCTFDPATKNDLKGLERHLKTAGDFLVGGRPSCADFYVWAALTAKPDLMAAEAAKCPNVQRWFKQMSGHKFSGMDGSDLLPTKTQSPPKKEAKPKAGKKDSFVSSNFKLPKSVNPKQWKNKMVTRFPPEPSGYLHIGHVRALLINYQLAAKCNGTMLLRFDDTNPDKENSEYVRAIEADIKALGMNWNKITHSSDYFDLMSNWCTETIKKGDFYVDRCSRDEMKQQKADFAPSPWRDRSPEESLADWEQMQKGESPGNTWCVRCKMDFKNNNGCLRDPVMYRYKEAPHVRFGTKYKFYPTYDFAIVVVDAIEGVTHSCRTNEYKDREAQYKWVFKLVCKGRSYNGKELKLPSLIVFSRLRFIRTVLSKRKLGKLVADKNVDGWSDPRMPTIRGILRRGLRLDSLLEFAGENAINNTDSVNEWDKIFNLNMKKLDPSSGRYFAVEEKSKMLVTIKGVDGEFTKKQALHPKKNSPLAGQTKDLLCSNQVYIEKHDAQQIKKGDRFALMNFDVVTVDEVTPTEVKCTLLKDAPVSVWKDKSIMKITWTAASKSVVPLKLVELDYLFNQDDTFNMNSWLQSDFIGEPALASLKKGDAIQIVRRGYYIVDRAFNAEKKTPAVLFFIPDGKEKEMSSLAAATSKIAIQRHD